MNEYMCVCLPIDQTQLNTYSYKLLLTNIRHFYHFFHIDHITIDIMGTAWNNLL